MRVRCVGHACLEVEAAGLRLVTDPWWAGPAYAGQWHAWPTPQPAGLDQRTVDYLYISHPHEDHLHLPTLKTLRPGASILVPELLTGGLRSRLKHLGFSQIIELPHGRVVRLRRGLQVTSYANVDDSILVFEDGDRVLVNVADALHTAGPHVVEHFCKTLRLRHPIIDTLFMGYAGESWWPNCVRIPGKNDLQAARSRESGFTDNFVKVVEALQPRIACAHGGAYVLLDPHQRWINDVRLETPTPDVIYTRKHPQSSTRAHLLLPNDVIDDLELVQGTTLRPTRLELRRALEGPLRELRERAEQLPHLGPDALKSLLSRIDTRVRANAARAAGDAPFAIEIRLREKPETALYIQVKRTGARVGLGSVQEPDACLELRAEVLDAILRDDAGVEAIFSGQGAVVTLLKADGLRHVRAALRLLSPRPTLWQILWSQARQDPERLLGALWRQRWPLLLAAGGRLGVLSPPSEKRTLGLASKPTPRQAA
jgi:hypothetical protein